MICHFNQVNSLVSGVLHILFENKLERVIVVVLSTWNSKACPEKININSYFKGLLKACSCEFFH